MIHFSAEEEVEGAVVTITEMTGMGEATEGEGETEIRIGVVEGAVSPQEEGEVAEGDMVILQPIIIDNKILLFYF